MNTEVAQPIYILMRGFEYEGSSVRSLHRTEEGARHAADEYMKSDRCYMDEGWEEVELAPQELAAGLVAEWRCGGQFVMIGSMAVQE